MIETNRNRNPTFTRLADKILARDQVRDTVGPQYLIPLLWIGADPAQIPFGDLPAKSIAMTNHSSGGNVVLERPIDSTFAIQKLRDGLKQNYYWAMREFQYYEIEPRVMVEEFLDDGHSDGPLDYRFWCFNGEPAAVQVDNHTDDLNAFCDVGWNNLHMSYREKGRQQEVLRPSNLDEMLSVASALSRPFDFVRIDLYSDKGKTYFGELIYTNGRDQQIRSPGMGFIFWKEVALVVESFPHRNSEIIPVLCSEGIGVQKIRLTSSALSRA
jgi:hypothetical protein